MSDPTRLHMRLKVTDRALLERLADRYGMTESGLIRWAIRYLDEHGPMQGKGETPMVLEFQFWYHKSSGERYAVRLQDSHVTGACGPLHYSEVKEELLRDFHYDDDHDTPALADSIDANQDDYGLVEFP